MAREPLVSCIIPAYNAAGTIARAIESARGQTYPNVEIVVVNDGSTDGTEDLVRSHFPDVTYVKHAENKGPPAARNSGARAAQGTVLALLDADDEWLPVKTEIQLDALARVPNVGVLLTGLLLVTRRWGNTIFPARAKVGLNHFTARDMLWGAPAPVTPASAMMYASTFSAFGGFEERRDLLEEELWVRMASRGLQLARLDLPLYIQHGTVGSLTSDARWMSNALMATIELCAPDSPRGRGINMSREEYARLRAKWLTTGTLLLTRAAQFSEARERLARELAAGSPQRRAKVLMFLVTRCPSLTRTLIRAVWFLRYLHTRAAYCRYARVLETCATDPERLQQAFPRDRAADVPLGSAP